MSIWIHSTGKYWVNNACVSAPACRERERYVHNFKNLWSSIFDCTPLVISTMLRTSLSMPEKGNIFISKQKHSFSQGDGADMFTTSRTCDRVSLTVPLWLFPLCFLLHLVCPRKSISSSQNKSIASRRVLLSVSMKICLSILRLYVLRRMDWDGSYCLLTNCTILSQEICFRGSHCYKCSLLVSGWRHNVSLTSQMDFKFARLFEILWIP